MHRYIPIIERLEAQWYRRLKQVNQSVAKTHRPSPVKLQRVTCRAAAAKCHRVVGTVTQFNLALGPATESYSWSDELTEETFWERMGTDHA